MKQQQPFKGKLLISDPSSLVDSVFGRSVILLAEHNPKGSVGFILNKPLNITLQDIVPDVLSNFRIYNGGPVEQDNLYFIHTVPELIPDSIKISEGIYWGGDFDTILDLLKEDRLKKHQIRFFLGYSGWESNQLEQELELSSWVVTQNKHNGSIIEKTNVNFWREKMIELGGDYLLWSNAPENPSAN